MNTIRRVRKSFAKSKEIVKKPHLIEMQRLSYEKFLQYGKAPEEREDSGLQAIFKSVFPIEDFNGTCSLEFVNYTFGDPKYSVEECGERGMTYDVPVKITVRLVAYDIDPDTGVKTIRDIKEQAVYLGSIPLMTKTGVFVVNGTERVIVSQLQRSPGLFYSHDGGKSHAGGKRLYSARIIPVRGSWIDLEYDAKDVLYVRIDRRRKFPVSTLLKALGHGPAELLEYFYDVEEVNFKAKKATMKFDPEAAIGQRAPVDIVHPKTGEVLLKAGLKIGKARAKKLVDEGVTQLVIAFDELAGKFVARDIVDPKTGEVFIPCNTELTETMLAEMVELKIKKIFLLAIDGVRASDSFRKTMALDKASNSEDALIEIYRRLRPSSPPTVEIATQFLENLFFNADTYDLSVVGRFKLNAKLGVDTDINFRTLTKDDIMMSVRELVLLKDRQGEIDDIDHLGNRRVRTVGELIENQYRMGLVRMERAIRERMSLQEIEAMMPHDLVNP
ncbi:MAG: DNA-directed RNA polymerase subunit beta, partial [Thermodesulfobacteriota bacterium]